MNPASYRRSRSCVTLQAASNIPRLAARCQVVVSHPHRYNPGNSCPPEDLFEVVATTRRQAWNRVKLGLGPAMRITGSSILLPRNVTTIAMRGSDMGEGTLAHSSSKSGSRFFVRHLWFLGM